MGQIGSQSVCGNCGTTNAAGEQFCENCGYSLAGGPTGPISVTSTSNPNAPTIMSSSSARGRRITGALVLGNLLGGRYRIVKLVGKGGFGAVYKARDERFQAQRMVAIKEMSDASLSPAERIQAIRDFRHEADMLVQLKHPNLPDVSDFFEEGGKAYLAMEFIEGKTLEKEQDDVGGPLDETLVMGWALQLCDVLNYLHTQPQPVIFRDLKPANIMLTKSGQIKLIDFGIARIFKSTAKKDTTSMGSQGYAPLEQYGRGQTDTRSDIYALGATLYDLLTKEVPTDAPTRRINPQLFETPRQLNPRVSPAVEGIVLKAMEQEPKDRFQSAAEMFQAIMASGVVTMMGSGMTMITSTMAQLTSSNPQLSATSMPTSPPTPAPAALGNIGPASMSAAPPPVAPTGSAMAPQQLAGKKKGSKQRRKVAPTGPAIAPQQQPSVPPPTPGPRRIPRRTLLGVGLAGAVAIGTGVYFFSRGGGSTPTPGPGSTITVNFTYSTEKSAWIQAVTNAFHNKGVTLNNKGIQIVLDERGSVDAQTKILSGEIKPTAWSPASFLELNQLSTDWQQQHNGADILINNGDLLPKSLVFSPLVFAVWKERADILTQHYHSLDWPAIHDALTKSSWSQIGGQAAWGPVKFGQTRPDQSNSGLLTITLLAYSFYNEQRNLTVDQVSSPNFLKYFTDIEGAVNAFGRSSGTFLQDVVIQGGPAQYDIVATYENLVLTLQQQAMQRQHQALQLFYPSVNILSDHPFAILQGNWVTSEERMAARAFRDFLLDTEPQRMALSSGFRPTNPNVQITDTVAGNVFRGQSADITISPQIQSLAQAPSGNAINKLLSQWTSLYNTAATTPGG